MIAYFILVHRYPEQFKRMFRAIYQPTNHYLVHIDKNSGTHIAKDIEAFLEPYQNAEILGAQRALWGGYSLVEAQLRGMQRLLATNADWTHFINLSGQDFPLKSQVYIGDFLKRNSGKEFIRVLDQTAVRPDTLNRIKHICIEMFGRIFRTSISRKFLKGATPYIGTQWMIVSRPFCEFVCNAPEAKRFKRFYRNSFIADESFFQTVMMNGAPHGRIVPDDLRMIDWIPDGNIKLRPRTFNLKDAAILTATSNLFARKFDLTHDSKIIDLLEQHIQLPAITAGMALQTELAAA